MAITAPCQATLHRIPGIIPMHVAVLLWTATTVDTSPPLLALTSFTARCCLSIILAVQCAVTVVSYISIYLVLIPDMMLLLLAQLLPQQLHLNDCHHLLCYSFHP